MSVAWLSNYITIKVCTVPSERWNHGGVYFQDETMYVYGGFSQRCADFCDDMWMFDIGMKSWRQVYQAGALSALDGFLDDFGNGGPGKRWRMSMVEVDATMAIFGGHRLWHGYALENSEENDWNDFTAYPFGGYLDDFWIYTKVLDLKTETGSDFKTTDGSWQKIEGKETCVDEPGLSWASRFDIRCFTLWPPERAGHAALLDEKRNLFWVFGGYKTYYPYLSTDEFGAGVGKATSSDGFVPYPSYLYYLNDMWYYNFTDGYWTEVKFDVGDAQPEGRMDMMFLLTEEVIFMHGGYANNYLYDDLWYFDLVTHKWLEKERFVYPKYPEGCTDDYEYIVDNNCSHIAWPNHIERDVEYPFEIRPYAEQDNYYDPVVMDPYWSMFDKGEAPNVYEFNVSEDSYRATLGRPMIPSSSSGPLQYAKSFEYTYNVTYTATLYESCTTVWAETNREHVVDGLFGRANYSVFIAQPRRRRPGWDGCRHRQDKRLVLPNELQYEKPYARAGHRGVYVNKTREILMYGGKSYLQEQPHYVNETWEYQISDEMWYFNFDVCVNNCSDHGDCKLGFCNCHVGYYGVDCSNTSCPGTFCYYDETTRDQVCSHACQSGYNHTDDDIYLPDMRKTPCSRELPGYSNGVCDGFGNAYCAPPFVGEDCSIKDCKYNCSFNGYCSIEYPVSRCMCNPGYFGEYCQEKYCLNECSYPNGLCNHTTGSCECRMMHDPYNNTREYKLWGGEDCSYISAYAAGPKSCSFSLVLCVAFILLTFLLQAVISNSDAFDEVQNERGRGIVTCVSYSGNGVGRGEDLAHQAGRHVVNHSNS